MGAIVLIIIRAYWFLIPQKFRRKCLYKETCSRQAYRLTKGYGWQAGMQSIWTRYNSCRPGYYFVTTPTATYVTMADGAVIPIQDLSEEIMASYQAMIENKKITSIPSIT